MTPEEFGRYLLRELLWEVSVTKHIIPDKNAASELMTVSPEQIEVLDYSGYNYLCLRVGTAVFGAHLTWKQVPPVIERIKYPPAGYRGQNEEGERG